MMRTYRAKLEVEFKVVVQESFVEDLRKQGDPKNPDADKFIREASNRHPINDDAFVEEVLRNGFRKGVRNCILNMMHHTVLNDTEHVMGGTVAPPRVQIVAAPPASNEAINPVEVQRKPKSAKPVLTNEKE